MRLFSRSHEEREAADAARSPSGDRPDDGGGDRLRHRRHRAHPAPL
ncbi:hypothetical protein ACFFX0_15675 [Citricoccus parietis]|uniref:Uncharacterized protein n=1 Tax=Citricoccus parietis TaxID=592307 RepID=A0ABV5G0U6_9MICC